MNFHDSERMAGLLEAAGYEPASEPGEADVVVLNTCTVREKAEDKVLSRIGEIRSEVARGSAPPVIAVAGCLAQQDGAALFRRAPRGGRCRRHQGRAPPPDARRPGDGDPLAADRREPLRRRVVPPGDGSPDGPVKAYVTIIEGCNDYCAFCVVPHTRGHERMRPKSEVLAEVREAVQGGRTEIHLLGQIVNHYQAPDDADCDFAGLLAAVDAVQGVRRSGSRVPTPARDAPARRSPSATCRASANTCICRCSRAPRGFSRRCAAGTRAPSISISCARSRRPCRASSSRPI